MNDNIDTSPRYFVIKGVDPNRNWIVLEGIRRQAVPQDFVRETACEYTHHYPLVEYTHPDLGAICDECNDLNQGAFDKALEKAVVLAQWCSVAWDMDVEVYDADGEMVHRANLDYKDGWTKTESGANIHKNATVDPKATLEKNSVISQWAIVEGRVLIQEGAHVGKGSVVMRGSIIESNVQIETDVVIGADCKICHDTRIGSYVRVGNDTVIESWCYIRRDARIGASVRLTDHCRIMEGAIINGGECIDTMRITGKPYSIIAMTNGIVAIGCEWHRLADWLKNSEAIASRNQFPSEQADEYGAYLDVCARWIVCSNEFPKAQYPEPVE